MMYLVKLFGGSMQEPECNSTKHTELTNQNHPIPPQFIWISLDIDQQQITAKLLKGVFAAVVKLINE